MKNLLLFLAVLVFFHAAEAQEKTELYSPSKEIRVEICNNAGDLEYSVWYKDKKIMEDMPLSMTFDNGTVAGEEIKTLKYRTEVRHEVFEPVVPVKCSKADIFFNETEFKFTRYSVIFRIYDDAVAYRFITRFGNKPVKVMAENVAYNFTGADQAYFPKERSMYTEQQCRYLKRELKEIGNEEFCSHPLLVCDQNIRMLVTEVDLESYPGVYYKKNGEKEFTGQFPHYPLETKKVSDRDLRVTRYAEEMARTTGNRSYPWRVTVINDDDAALLNSNTIYALAAPSRVPDAASWISFGKATWDWWNNRTLTGVDFESGFNDKTYQYYIDFAAANGIEFLLIDEGWYDTKKSILDIVDDLDVKGLIEYGKKKNVGIILWATWLAMDEHMEEAFEKYSEMGVKGFKIDFMQRDDQKMIDWYYSTAELAARYHMLLDFHGGCKPFGLTRTFPNMLTSESVFGNEQNRCSVGVTPEHNVTLPFTRMALGPMDFTPGSMRNTNRNYFRVGFRQTMSQGTRCNQLAMFVIFESPLQMLCDSPTKYQKEPDILKFISGVPTVWDETRALSASISEYIIMARRNGNRWWLGGMCNETERTEEVSLDFLEGGKTYKMTIWEDGVNAHKDATDFRMSTRTVKKGDKISVKLAAGGGFVASFE